jgi:NADPH:quinone reductase-like Zn-dependent oxidoreductase
MAVTVFGGCATRLVLPRSQVFPLPRGWDLVQAAGFPVAFLTAWFALLELAHPRPGARVSVHSAAGGVGGALVQLARLADCRVVGVVGASHKVEEVRALGAEAVIDRSQGDLWAGARAQAPGGYDLVPDANGAATLGQSYRHLAPVGRLVVYGFHAMASKGRGRPRWLKLAWHALRTPRFNPLRMTAENRIVLALILSFVGDRLDLLQVAMADLLEWAEGRRIRALRTHAYPFEQVAEAHRALEGGETVGKLVLVVEERS